MVRQFLLYNKVNQLYIYICPHISSLLHLPPSHPPLQVVTKHRADLPVLCGSTSSLGLCSCCASAGKIHLYFRAVGTNWATTLAAPQSATVNPCAPHSVPPSVRLSNSHFALINFVFHCFQYHSKVYILKLPSRPIHFTSSRYYQFLNNEETQEVGYHLYLFLVYPLTTNTFISFASLPFCFQSQRTPIQDQPMILYMLFMLPLPQIQNHLEPIYSF